MKYGVLLALMVGLLVGISSGGLFADSGDYSGSGWGWIGLPEDMHPSNLSPFGYIKPFNLSDYLYPEPKVPVDTDTTPWEPVPLVMPEPLPITKDELFGSLTLISEDKQSLLSSMKTTPGFF